MSKLVFDPFLKDSATFLYQFNVLQDELEQDEINEIVIKTIEEQIEACTQTLEQAKEKIEGMNGKYVPNPQNLEIREYLLKSSGQVLQNLTKTLGEQVEVIEENSIRLFINDIQDSIDEWDDKYLKMKKYANRSPQRSPGRQILKTSKPPQNPRLSQHLRFSQSLASGENYVFTPRNRYRPQANQRIENPYKYSQSNQKKNNSLLTLENTDKKKLRNYPEQKPIQSYDNYNQILVENPADFILPTENLKTDSNEQYNSILASQNYNFDQSSNKPQLKVIHSEQKYDQYNNTYESIQLLNSNSALDNQNLNVQDKLKNAKLSSFNQNNATACSYNQMPSEVLAKDSEEISLNKEPLSFQDYLQNKNTSSYYEENQKNDDKNTNNYTNQNQNTGTKINYDNSYNAKYNRGQQYAQNYASIYENNDKKSEQNSDNENKDNGVAGYSQYSNSQYKSYVTYKASYNPNQVKFDDNQQEKQYDSQSYKKENNEVQTDQEKSDNNKEIDNFDSQNNIAIKKDNNLNELTINNETQNVKDQEQQQYKLRNSQDNIQTGQNQNAEQIQQIQTDQQQLLNQDEKNLQDEQQNQLITSDQANENGQQQNQQVQNQVKSNSYEEEVNLEEEKNKNFPLENKQEEDIQNQEIEEIEDKDQNQLEKKKQQSSSKGKIFLILGLVAGLGFATWKYELYKKEKIEELINKFQQQK